jgi:hypothetical protein
MEYIQTELKVTASLPETVILKVLYMLSLKKKSSEITLLEEGKIGHLTCRNTKKEAVSTLVLSTRRFYQL